jgi:hypothetical protein
VFQAAIYVCLITLTLMSVAGPIHRHDSGQDAMCWPLCHAGKQATIVATFVASGSPLIIAPDAIMLVAAPRPICLFAVSDRSPRAPPLQLLEL